MMRRSLKQPLFLLFVTSFALLMNTSGCSAERAPVLRPNDHSKQQAKETEETTKTEKIADETGTTTKEDEAVEEDETDGITMPAMVQLLEGVLERVAQLEDANVVLEERILALESERTAFQQKLAELETATKQSTQQHAQHERRLQDSCITSDSKSAGLLYMEGCNIHIRNGGGFTDRINGLGNLIIGYNEADSNHHRTGSHNIVVGTAHDWKSHSGIVSGRSNDINRAASVALGGHNNVVDGGGSTCIGGSGNVVRTDMGNLLGGAANVVAGLDSVVVGGSSNTAQAQSSVVIGGKGNIGTTDFGVTM